MTIKQTPYLIAAILLPFLANAQTTATTTTTSGNQSSATVNATVAPNATAASGSNPSASITEGGEAEEEKKGEEYVNVNIKIYRWGFANSISMPDFGTGIISSRKAAAAKDSNLFYKSDDKWHELKIAPRQMVTIKYKGPKTMRFSRLKTNLPNPEKPEADENFTGAGSFEVPIPSGDIFALMIKSGNNARFYPMNISPKELPKNKFAVMNMTRQSVAFNINGQTSIIGPGRSFIFSPKKKDDAGITCQIAKRVKGKWIPCYKNIISLPDDSRTMLLVYDPANKAVPRFNVQVLNLR